MRELSYLGALPSERLDNNGLLLSVSIKLIFLSLLLKGFILTTAYGFPDFFLISLNFSVL